MSIEALAWALRVPVGGNTKIVLLGLANHAHEDGSEAYPSLNTLSRYACCDRSTARRHIRELLDLKWVEKTGEGPRKQAKFRLCMERPVPKIGGSKSLSADVGQNAPSTQSGMANDAPVDGTSTRGGVATVPPEPSIEPSIEEVVDVRASAPSVAAEAGSLSVAGEGPRAGYEVWAKVESILRKVPEWGDQLDQGADIACVALIDGSRELPWVVVASEAVSSRLDPLCGLRTNSPQQALSMKARDFRGGGGFPVRQADAGQEMWDEVERRLRAVVLTQPGADRDPAEFNVLTELRFSDPVVAALIALGSFDTCRRLFRASDSFKVASIRKELVALWSSGRLVNADHAVVERLRAIDFEMEARKSRGFSRDDFGIRYPPLDERGAA